MESADTQLAKTQPLFQTRPVPQRQVLGRSSRLGEALGREITRPIDDDFHLIALRAVVPRGLAALMTTQVALKSYLMYIHRHVMDQRHASQVEAVRQQGRSPMVGSALIAASDQPRGEDHEHAPDTLIEHPEACGSVGLSLSPLCLCRCAGVSITQYVSIKQLGVSVYQVILCVCVCTHVCVCCSHICASVWTGAATRLPTEVCLSFRTLVSIWPTTASHWRFEPRPPAQCSAKTSYNGMGLPREPFEGRKDVERDRVSDSASVVPFTNTATVVGAEGISERYSRTRTSLRQPAHGDRGLRSGLGRRRRRYQRRQRYR